jgi:hypothetical protein
MGEYMNLRIIPIDEPSIHPYEFGSLYSQDLSLHIRWAFQIFIAIKLITFSKKEGCGGNVWALSQYSYSLEEGMDYYEATFAKPCDHCQSSFRL